MREFDNEEGCQKKKKRFITNMVPEERSTRTLDHQKGKQIGPGAKSACNIAGGKNDKTEAALLPAHLEKAGFSGKDKNAGKNRR